MSNQRNRIIDWVDQRFPLTRFIKDELTEYPTPRNLSYWWGFGFLAGFMLVLQIVSGLFLAMHYKPDAALAFDSVQHIMRDVNYGWLLRYLHSTGASAFFVVIYLHMARTLYYGSYRAPRELMWWSGQVLLLMLMATAFMGYLLPWGQMSYWGAQVITSLFGATPFIGDEVVVWLRGDYVVGDATLNRFFALHYLLPFLIFGLVMIHLVALHFVKSSNPSGINLRARDNIPFHPYFTIKDFFGLGIFLIAFCGFVFFAPEFFIETDNNIPANPMQTPPHIQPEWYFLPFYAILRAVPNTVGGVVAMVLSILIFAAMPYLDRSRIPGGARYRPLYRILFFIFVIDIVVLSYVGSEPLSDNTTLVGQIATIVYFGLFLLIPVISKPEERWLRKRGLPKPLEELLASEDQPLKKPLSFPVPLLLIGAVAILLTAFDVHAAEAKLADVKIDASPAAVQRGAQVVTQVCMACHGLKYVTFRDLQVLGMSQAEVDQLRGEQAINTPLLSMTPPEAAKESYGIVPPDLSLMAKARAGGARYIYTLLTSFHQDAKGDIQNRIFPGIRMPDPLGYSSAADAAQRRPIEQQAHDVAAFLAWAADPRAGERHRAGYIVIGYLAIFTGLLYLLKRRVWARLPPMESWRS
ncbi:MAG: cytochrome b N-terminal domain-containing protein [Gammaproteobacteria bacterium]|nr:cytochrome b N-terminal domain-containing protein [Gammaproteobacteria bacterium]